MYFILFSALIAGFGAQILKILIEIARGTFVSKDIWEYGGMPSSHTAFVAALTTAVALQEGFSSPTFALALILAILMIRDSVGLRRQAGLHGQALNAILKHYPKEAKEFRGIKNRLGHTVPEAAIGIAFGIIVAIALYHFS